MGQRKFSHQQGRMGGKGGRRECMASVHWTGHQVAEKEWQCRFSAGSRGECQENKNRGMQYSGPTDATHFTINTPSWLNSYLPQVHKATAWLA